MFRMPVVFLILMPVLLLSANLGNASDQLSVFVSIVPQKYFVQRICRDRARIHVMVQPGDNPATYEPKPRQMAELAGAKAYFAIDVPFAQAYGVEQIPIEIEGKDPKPAQLKELIERARNKEIKVIFAQPQFSDRSARLVAREIGGQVVFADPLSEDWIANLMTVADKFKAALK
jgi:ABC-type Zn uptake system ZnuABC Zn-binding protein ZnuA